MSKRGWWKLEITGVDELNDADQHNISSLIRDGFTEGEIVQENVSLFDFDPSLILGMPATSDPKISVLRDFAQRQSINALKTLKGTKK